MSDWLVERMTEQIRGLQDELAEANRLRVQAEGLMESANASVRRKNLKIASLEATLARAAIEPKVSWTAAEE